MSSRPVTQWKGHGTWSSSADGQFLLETPRAGGACSNRLLLVDASSSGAVIRIWRTAPRQELLGNVSASEARQMLTRIVVQVLRTSRNSHDRP